MGTGAGSGAFSAIAAASLDLLLARHRATHPITARHALPASTAIRNWREGANRFRLPSSRSSK
jgi:hypothetical protein